jgi:hypothetical protein
MHLEAVEHAHDAACLRVCLPAEVAVLGGLIGGVAVLATYTIKKTLLNNESGS